MPKRKKVVKLQERPRNLLTLAPIMQKGGAHGKSDKALRRAERQHTQMSAREEFSSRGDGQSLNGTLSFIKSILFLT
jgi:hypothetical protein